MKKSIFLIAALLLSLKSFSQRYISKQKAIEDIDFYNTTLQAVHYNPFLFIKEKKYFAEVDKLKKSLKDSVQITDFIVSLYRLSALIKDGHASPQIIQPVLTEELKKPEFLPYSFIIDKKRLYVPKSTSAVSGIPAGSEIIAVNNTDARKFLKQAQQYLGGNEGNKQEMTGKLLSYLLFLNSVKAPFNIHYKNVSGKKGHKMLEKGVSLREALTVAMPHLSKKYTFRLIGNKVAHLDFMAMSGDIKAFGTFLDSCFTQIKAKNIKYLAIDLRKNSGGNSVFGDLLLSYLTDKKYTLSGGKKWRVSRQYKDLLQTIGDTSNAYLQKENGTIWELGNCEPKENKFRIQEPFSGYVYFLTGPFTFSSANMLAAGAKKYGIGEIIGEPTGQNTTDFGEAYVFELPNSKIKMQTTTALNIGADCSINKLAPVMPDKHMPRNLSNRISEADPVLEYILNKAK